MGFGWTSSYGSGVGSDTITSGIEGAWTANPTQWDNGYFDLLFGYEGANQESCRCSYLACCWAKEEDMAPDAEDASVKVPTMMTTADMAMREDPSYKEISKRFHENPDEFADAFARLGSSHCIEIWDQNKIYGSGSSEEELIWQDPVPAGDSTYDVSAVKEKILNCGLSIQEMIETAWSSASTYRGSDMRGGANGARIRLEPQKNWEANNPDQLSKVLEIYEAIAEETGASVADVIVLAGNVAIEKASGIEVPLVQGEAMLHKKILM